MSYDKVTKSVNRFHDRRVIRNQSAIYLLYNESHWLTERRIGQLRKAKAMNCSCGTCRGWAKEGKRYHSELQLRKAGMTKARNIGWGCGDEYEGFDERPDICTRDEHDDLIKREEDWI